MDKYNIGNPTQFRKNTFGTFTSSDVSVDKLQQYVNEARESIRNDYQNFDINNKENN